MKRVFNQSFSCLRMIFAAWLSCALLLLLPTGVVAQQEEANSSDTKEIEELRPLTDLGDFRIKDWRPTRNETIQLTFHMHLALNKTAGEKTIEQLEHWKHRLRNQVFIAVRLAERQDYLEPGLHRFRRIVKLRINRLMKSHLVDEALLTEFTLTTN